MIRVNHDQAEAIPGQGNGPGCQGVRRRGANRIPSAMIL